LVSNIHPWHIGGTRKNFIPYLTRRVVRTGSTPSFISDQGSIRHQWQEYSEEKAWRILAGELGGLGWQEQDLAKRLKADADKVRIAARLRQETTMTLNWIAVELQLGSWTYLSNNQSKINPRPAPR